MIRVAVTVSVLVLSAVGCVAELGPPPTTSSAAVVDASSAVDDSAPLIGVDGAGDFADRACQIVLHDAGRVQQGTGFATVAGSSSWLFDARVDVDQDALAEGFAPMLLVRSGSDPSWRPIAADASVAVTGGTERFLFTIDSGNLPGPGMSATGLSRAKVSLIPFLTRGDARLFDHNRIADAFAVYELTSATGFAVGVDDSVCAAPAGPTVRFNADWSVQQSAPIVAGGTVTVDYDLARLPSCRGSYAGRPAWNIQAYARFLPMDTTAQGQLLDTGASTSSTWVARPATFDVPAGATSVEFWFQNSDRYGCNTWDSNFGENHAFDVVTADADDRAPDWMGNVTATISRGASRRCEGGVAFGNTVSFGTWARQRAAITDLCFEVWEPGVTDNDAATPWQALDARVEASWAGASDTTTSYVTLVDRVGNNARYAVDLRAFDPFIWGRCLDGIPLTSVEENGAPMVQATAELRMTVNGKALATDGGDVFRVIYSDHADAPRVSCE